MCCTVEEVVNEFEEKIQQKINERLAAHREVDALNDG